MTHWGITKHQLDDALEELRREETATTPPRRTKAYLPLGFLMSFGGFVLSAVSTTQVNPRVSNHESLLGILLGLCGVAVFQYGMLRQGGRRRRRALAIVLLTFCAVLGLFWLCYVSLA